MSKSTELVVQQAIGFVAAATITTASAMAATTDKVELDIDQSGRINVITAPGSLSDEVEKFSTDEMSELGLIINVNCLCNIV